MNTYKDLKRGLAQLAERAIREGKYENNKKLREANEKALKMCKHPNAIYAYETSEDVLPINVTYRSLWRVNRLLRKNGIDWPLFDWKALLEWLYENWDKVLRVMLSLLMLIIL